MAIVILLLFGVAVGWVAHRLVPSPLPGGLILDCVLGLVGSLVGAWVAERVFDVRIGNDLARPSTWLSAILGAAGLLLASRVLFGSAGRGRRGLLGR